MAALRTLTLWCADWPLVAVGPLVGAEPVAILEREQVLACSAAARAEGVCRGMRRREAQRRCPTVRLVERDQVQEVRAYEPILAALGNICPVVEVIRPGLCAFPASGAARYFGSDEALAEAVADALRAASSGGPQIVAHVGIADGAFAATLAARTAADGPVIVAPGRTLSFLAPFPVSVLERPDLADLFGRLGLRTLGDVAGLPLRDVASRFGAEGRRAHRLARGLDARPLNPRLPPQELDVTEELDPPVEQVEPLAFVAKALADRLAADLAHRGITCTRLLVEAETEYGQSRSRIWRADGALTAAAVAQRVRWQLEGWLTGPAGDRPTAGITLLRLAPQETHFDDGEQLPLFAGPTDADERAAAAATRLQGLLGFDAVCVPVPTGGRRSPGGFARLVPYGESAIAQEALPWPGRIPAPSPTVVYPDALPATVVDAHGNPVALDARGTISAAPQALSVHDSRAVPVGDWAGPWFLDELWWDRAAHLTSARFHVVTADGAARLLALRGGQWWVEGWYS